MSITWAPGPLGKPGAAHCFPGYDIYKHFAPFPKCRSVKEIWIVLLETRRHTLDVYKIEAKFILNPNLNRSLLSLCICSVRVEGDQAASEEVPLPFAYIAGFPVTLNTGITRDLLQYL